MKTKRLALLSAAALASLFAVQAANASTATMVFVPGGTAAAFAAVPGNAPHDTFDSNVVGGSPSGSVAIYTGPALVYGSGGASNAAEPAGDTTPFIAIQPGSSEVISFVNPGLTVGFYWGSVDTYNVPITVTFSDATTEGFTPFAPADGNRTIAATNGYVYFVSDSAATITSLTLGTTGVAFELDNVFASASRASTTPLPGALPLFASGLGALGLFGWRRKKAKASALTA